MSITLSPSTEAAFKSLVTSGNSTTVAETGTLIVFAPIADVQGLAADIAAVIPTFAKPYAVAMINENGSEVYLANSADDAADTMGEMYSNMMEAIYC